MKSLFANVWTKRVVSVLSVVYTYFVIRLCYLSIFYNITVHERTSLCIALSGLSLAAIVVMLYTRKQILTRICSFLILPAMLPVVLLYFGEWGMIIPIIVVGIVILLLSGAGEGVKTALATMILLAYIFTALGYFMFTSFFVASTKEEVIGSGVSPSGEYRYRIVNTIDSSDGCTSVYVEPNTADIKNAFATFSLKNLERIVYTTRPSIEEVDVKWETQTRQDITKYYNSISDRIEVTLTDAELKDLGYTYDNKLMLTNLSASRKFALNRTASQVDPVPIDQLNQEQLDFFGIAKDAEGRYYVKDPSPELVKKNGSEPGDRLYFNEMKPKALKYFNNRNVDPPTGITYFNVQKSHTVMLNSLTDEQLAKLGVSDKGDVMTIVIHKNSHKSVDEEDGEDTQDEQPTSEEPTAEAASEEGGQEQTDPAENSGEEAPKQEAKPAEEKKDETDTKVIFRYYVAELEDYYDLDSRRLSLELLNS
ncbi:MAG: hypothetical protein IKW96_07695 [Ruminococcus sp.]|uniref:hypothetical protein n=1 Tax=Ruminococcus sp. TaxID=41978 RepID=UPI0025FE70F1|nr:hypothetical protein [Ruminococcus sp.]MBR5683148.1 hypothetical protein [Ruminococcus sp.]